MLWSQESGQEVAQDSSLIGPRACDVGVTVLPMTLKRRQGAESSRKLPKTTWVVLGKDGIQQQVTWLQSLLSSLHTVLA